MMNRIYKNNYADKICGITALSLLTAVIFLCFATKSYAQKSRTEAMGGLNYSITDQDNSLTPFDFTGNPAWLFMDKQETYLDINPSIGNSWGNYRRKYDSEGTSYMDASFEGIKTLDSLGTFLGRASYSYENRRNYNRILTKDAYAGEGFFYADTTSGAFRYKGPSMEFMYSWELLPGLYAGGSLYYGLLEGLKEIYTYAQTMYREIDLTAGLAYRFSDHFIAGGLAEYSDSQESISSKDINSFSILVYNFRGDTYSIPTQAAVVSEKAKKSKMRFGGHFYFEITPAIELAARADYSASISKMIRPSNNLLVEEARASFENVDAQIQSRFNISKNFLASLIFTHTDIQSWSKNSWSNLLLWKWHTKQNSIGAGLSYNISSSLLIAGEFSFAKSSLDSSKYIDGRFVSLNSNDFLYKAGAEYELTPNFLLRAGYNRGLYEEDLLYGGENTVYNSFTAGIGLKIFNIIFNTHINYAIYSADNITGRKRSLIGGYLTMRLNSF